jgi:hypothetical protein
MDEQSTHTRAHAPARAISGEMRASEARSAGLPSTYRSGFGQELPRAVYLSIIAGFGFMLAVAWLAFGADADTDLDLMVVTVLCAVFLLLPVIMYRSGPGRTESEARRPDLKGFLAAGIDTATGPLQAREAWLQVLLAPAALAIAAVLIGAVYVLFG